jgi:surface antigen
MRKTTLCFRRRLSLPIGLAGLGAACTLAIAIPLAGCQKQPTKQELEARLQQYRIGAENKAMQELREEWASESAEADARFINEAAWTIQRNSGEKR